MSTALPTEWVSLLLQLQDMVRSQTLATSKNHGALPIPSLSDWLAGAGGSSTDPPHGESPTAQTFAPGSSISPEQWRAIGRYGQALSALQAAWVEIGLATWSQSQSSAQTPAEPGALRAAYDRWAEVGERLFSERAATDEYGALIGELINAQVDLHLAYGLGEAPEPEDPRELKEALAEARAREKQLREDLEALRAQGVASQHSPEKTTRKKSAKKSRSSAAESRPVKKKARSQTRPTKKKVARVSRGKTSS